MFKSTFVGHLGRDAELRYTPSGQAVANFSAASTEKWKDANGEVQERTTWVKFDLWGKRAEALNQYLTKGKLVLIECRIKTPRTYEKNGETKSAGLEATVLDIQLLGGKRGADEDGEPTGEPTGVGAPAQEDTDDIPF